MTEPRTMCPECVQGKHGNCTHVADLAVDDSVIDCACGCLESRTCPSCADVVPEGWTLDDHFNCNWPEETFPYEVVTAPLGNRFGAHSLADVEHMKSIWTVTEVIDNTIHPDGSRDA